MTTRTRTAWRLRGDGQYDCRVGWKINASGKREQHRFRLGSDLKEAKRRDDLLRQLWERIESTAPSAAYWSDDTLNLAKAVAGGTVHWHVVRHPSEEVVPYAQRVHYLRQLFPMIAILPEMEYGSALGVALLTAMDNSMNGSDTAAYENQIAVAQQMRRQVSGALLGNVPIETGPYVHDALNSFIDWLKREYHDPKTTVTPWGRTQIRQIESLISHHSDVPLSRIGRNEVEEMFRYWRQRPLSKGKPPKQISKKSATHYLSALRNFFKWLHSSPLYPWRKPDGFEDLKTNVISTPGEQRRQISEHDVFSLEELKTLYHHARPLERLLILLGLNCGFGAAESASLLIEEIFIRVPPNARQLEMLGTHIAPDDSFIRRIRNKSGVYGEHLLFKETVRGIEWMLAKRSDNGCLPASDRLLVNGNGEPFDKPTHSGNANRQIPNLHTRLLLRASTEKSPISKLPFKTFRKTGGDLVKRFSDGEVAGVFLCHGKPVSSDELADAYTQRCFGKVFEAIRKVEDYLRPVFCEAESKPW